jgi:hypothetical protein
MRSQLTGANRKSGGSLTPRSRLCAPMVERVSGRVRMEVAARTSGRCRFNSVGGCHLLRQHSSSSGNCAMRAVENALDDEQVAALFPFVQFSRDAVQHAEVRSLWFGGSARCGRGERRPIVATAIAEGQRLEPGAPTWRADAKAGPAGPIPPPPRLRLLVVRGELRPVLRDEHGKQPCRLGRARVLAHRMGAPRRLEPALASLVDRDRTVIHLGANRALEHVGDDRRGEAARRDGSGERSVREPEATA